EQRYLAQVLRTHQQHHHAVDAERAAAMRRRAILERAVEPTTPLSYIILAEANLLKRLHHQFRRLVTDGARCNPEPVAGRAILERAVEPTKTLFYIILAEANLLKRLHHQFRRLVTDGARCNLEPVADRVILVSLERQRIGIVKRLNATLRHGERVVREVDLFLVFVPLVERKVDNPAKLEPVAIDQVQLLASARAGGACKGSELFRIACRKEAGVAITQAKLLADGFGTLLADILGDRARAFQLVAFLAP